MSKYKRSSEPSWFLFATSTAGNRLLGCTCINADQTQLAVRYLPRRRTELSSPYASE